MGPLYGTKFKLIDMTSQSRQGIPEQCEDRGQRLTLFVGVQPHMTHPVTPMATCQLDTFFVLERLELGWTWILHLLDFQFNLLRKEADMSDLIDTASWAVTE